VERVARGLVIATTACLLFAIVAAAKVLSHGSGTFMALVVFAPILLLPGALVFWKPQPRFLSVWAIWSFIASVVYLIGGSPYYYERELPDWQCVQWPTWIAILITIVATTILSFAMAAKARPPLPASPRARRVQQATRLSVALALVTIVLTIVAMNMPATGVFWNAVWLVFIVAPAPYVHRAPQRSTAFMWAAWVSPFAACLAILSLAMPDSAAELELPVRIWLMTHGTLLAMICIVTPVVAFISSDEQSDLPSARVH
jgi:hypothetical protein